MLKRKFKTIYDYAKKLQSKLDETEGKMFKQCYLNTLETTASFLGGVYIKTGDIPAMWLRDSSAQVSHYVRLAGKDKNVADLIKGVLKRQFKMITIDPYANAFNKRANGKGHKDLTLYNKHVWERKYEIDSLVYPFWLLNRYYSNTGDKSVFEQYFAWALKTVIELFITEQNHDEMSSYTFERVGEYSFDSLPNGGKGNPSGYTGMIWSAFRPSDDRCEYHYLVPSNMFVVATFGELLTNLKNANVVTGMEKVIGNLIEEVERGIKKYAVVDSEFGKMYCYETDGKGNVLLMDDANVPSLLSMPYLGYCDKNDELYLNTRKFILSKSNPYYYEGKVAKGVGSPHTPKNYIWHISLIIEALTSTSDEEISRIRNTLNNTTDGTLFMHEGFSCDDDGKFTREWFAWANTLYSIFVMDCILKEKN